MLLAFFALRPGVSRAQLTHLDSVLAQNLRETVEARYGGAVILQGDSILAPLLSSAPSPIGTCLSMFYIEYLSTTITQRDSGKARLNFEIRGVFLNPTNRETRKDVLSRSVDIAITPADSASLARHESRYLERTYDSYVTRQVAIAEPPSSLWSSTIEPILVVAGAIAIVALFFLIRS